MRLFAMIISAMAIAFVSTSSIQAACSTKALCDDEAMVLSMLDWLEVELLLAVVSGDREAAKEIEQEIDFFERLLQDLRGGKEPTNQSDFASAGGLGTTRIVNQRGK